MSHANFIILVAALSSIMIQVVGASSNNTELGYFTTSFFNSDDCKVKSISYAESKLIGTCNIHQCSGNIRYCVASKQFVQTATTDGFIVTYQEFSSEDCSQNNIIFSQDTRLNSNVCDNRLIYSYDTIVNSPLQTFASDGISIEVHKNDKICLNKSYSIPLFKAYVSHQSCLPMEPRTNNDNIMETYVSIDSCSESLDTYFVKEYYNDKNCEGMPDVIKEYPTNKCSFFNPLTNEKSDSSIVTICVPSEKLDEKNVSINEVKSYLRKSKTV